MGSASTAPGHDDPIRELRRLHRHMTDEILRLIAALLDPNPNLREIIMDFTGLLASIANIDVIAASLQATISGDVATAVAAQKTADQAAIDSAAATQKQADQQELDAQVASLNEHIAALQAALDAQNQPPAPAPEPQV
jgi:hypothetical protein